MDRQPLYLENDGLKDCIVSFSYRERYDADYMLDYLFGELKQRTGKVMTRVPQRTKIRTARGMYSLTESYFLTDGTYRVMVTEEKMSFNIVADYHGWSHYTDFIYVCLDIMQELINDVTDIEIRYISAFERVSIFDNLQGVINLANYPRFKGSEFNFRFMIDGYPSKKIAVSKAIVRLKNLVNRTKDDIPASIVDIQLTSDVTAVNQSADTVRYNLEHIHQQEKNIFYSLLSQEFIKTLKPHYDIQQ